MFDLSEVMSQQVYCLEIPLADKNRFLIEWFILAGH